ncbi:translation initiation factor IF-2-like [Myotis myotis]|uniref:Uncharacterized protein n=1 Tax=Myotis myotis TaxID=51298 RepID=A0A7J7U5H1_MYOMY|nr:translation initiation factor IF-2-like [Myotis myotis]KAF6308120.1 hypothetical protein mMyoMyo1_008898 [Myotis myotis]
MQILTGGGPRGPPSPHFCISNGSQPPLRSGADGACAGGCLPKGSRPLGLSFPPWKGVLEALPTLTTGVAGFQLPACLVPTHPGHRNPPWPRNRPPGEACGAPGPHLAGAAGPGPGLPGGGSRHQQRGRRRLTETRLPAQDAPPSQAGPGLRPDGQAGRRDFRRGPGVLLPEAEAQGEEWPGSPETGPRSAGEGRPRRGTWRPEPEEVSAGLAFTTNSSACLASPAERTSISPDGPQPVPWGKRAFP